MRILFVALLFSACGERVRLVVVVPELEVAGAKHSLGDELDGRTARFYEDRGALFVTEGGVKTKAADGLVRGPLQVEQQYVVAPFAATHADAAAADKGVKRLEMGKQVSVARGLVGLTSLLLLDGTKPVAFVRATDVRPTPPTADELVRAAKNALLDADFVQARTYAEAAMAKDAKHSGANRVLAAVLFDAKDPRGWELWTVHQPAEAPSEHLPKPPPIVVGPGFVLAHKVALREKANPKSTKLRTLAIGASVEVVEVNGEWAEVDVQSDRTNVSIAVLSEDELQDGAAPWEQSEEGGAATTHGFVIAKLLSAAPPDPAALRSFGMERASQSAWAEAVVPLRRALALKPDEEAKRALVKAAVEAEQLVIAVETLRLDAKPLDAAVPPYELELIRVRGCRGDRTRARDRVEDSEAVLAAPVFDATAAKQDKGRITLNGLPKDVCVTDDEAEAACAPESYVATLDEHFGYVCGQEPPAKYSTTQLREYTEYRKERRADVARAGARHEAHQRAFDAWEAKAKEELPGSAVIIRLRASVARPPGKLGVYRFAWEEQLWCGDKSHAARQDLRLATVATKAMRDGELLELWIDDADLSLAWGAVLIDALKPAEGEGSPLQSFVAALKEESPHDDGWKQVPAAYRDIAVERGRGIRACDVSNECCGC